MIITLKMLHLLALVFGSLASLGNIYLGFANGPHDLDAPAYTNRLRKMYRITGLIAIITLWITGLALLLGKYGVWVPGFAFSAKIAFAVLITVYLLFVNLMSSGWAKAGGPPSYMPMLTWISFLALVFTVVFAVAAFG